MIDKERLERIGKFLNDRLIIHRNVENNTPWTTEEKMIQELYDNYLDILIKYKKQKEVIDKAIDKLGKYAIVIRSNGEAYTICVDLLDILKGDSNG